MRVVQIVAGVGRSLGGAAMVVLESNRALNSIGVEAEVLTTDRADVFYNEITFDERRSIDDRGAKVCYFPASRPQSLFNSWRLAIRIATRVRSADIVEVHGQYSLPVVYGYLAARISSKPLLVHPHGTLEPYIRAKSPLRKRLYELLVGDRLLRSAALIIVGSEEEAANAKLKVPNGRVAVVPLGASLDRPEVDLLLSDRVGLQVREHTVLFLGRLALKKAPDLLIRAWASMDRPKDAKLIIAGPESDFSVKDINLLARSLDVEDSVVTVGPVYGPQKSWLYERCGIFAFPSYSENFGLTLAEALLAGSWVIVSEGVAAKEYVLESGGGEVVESQCVPDWAAALDRGLKSLDVDQKLSWERSVQVAAYAERKFSWEGYARNLVACVERFCLIGVDPYASN